MIFAKQFSGVSFVDMGPAFVAGDWESLVASVNVTPSVNGSVLQLTPSVDGGASWITTGFNSHDLRIYDTGTPPFSANNNIGAFPGPIYLGNQLVGSYVDGICTYRQPNFGAPQKHSQLFSQGHTPGASTPYFSWEMYGEHTLQANPYGCMINALRLSVSTGTMEGRISLTGQQNVDQFPAPAFPMKVAIMGASLVFGGGYCFALASALEAKYPGITAIVRNFGSGGQTTLGGMINVNSVIAFQPDVVILAFCASDSFPSYGISMSQSAVNHAAIIASLQAVLPGVSIFIMTENPMIGAGAAAFPNLSAYYQNGRNIAAAQGVGLIDVEAVWGTPNAGQYVDGTTHPFPAINIAKLVPVATAAI